LAPRWQSLLQQPLPQRRRRVRRRGKTSVTTRATFVRTVATFAPTPETCATIAAAYEPTVTGWCAIGEPSVTIAGKEIAPGCMRTAGTSGTTSGEAGTTTARSDGIGLTGVATHAT